MQKVLNLSLIEGRLTRDPELMYTKNGVALCKFDLAVNQPFKSGDKFVDAVSYIAVDTWSKVAECCAKYLKKGNNIRVNGRLKQSSWQDKDGKKRYKISVEASGVDFLGSQSKDDNKKYHKEKIPF